MTWSVHNHHVPAVEIDEAGTMTHGSTRPTLKEPLFTADTREDTEE